MAHAAPRRGERAVLRAVENARMTRFQPVGLAQEALGERGVAETEVRQTAVERVAGAIFRSEVRGPRFERAQRLCGLG